jgi:hypothetical protein
LLASRSAPGAGVEGVDDGAGDDNDDEAGVVGVAYFRLLTTVGALLGLLTMGLFKERSLTSMFFNGSEMNLTGFSMQNHGSTRPQREQDKQRNNASGSIVCQTKEPRI